MIRFYYHPTPNPAKGRADARGNRLGLSTLVPVRYQQRRTTQARIPRYQSQRQGTCYRRHGRAPAEKKLECFDPSAILLYLGDKSGRLIGSPAGQTGTLVVALLHCDRHRAVLGPGGALPARRSRKAFPTPINHRYRREVERHYEVLDTHLKGREFIVGKDFTSRRYLGVGMVGASVPRVLRRVTNRHSRRRFQISNAGTAHHRRALRGG